MNTTPLRAPADLSTTSAQLDHILNAASAVVVGASPHENSIRGRALAHAKQFGFGGEGQLYAVNPRHERVQNVPCFPSVSELPEAVDVALVAVPADAVAEVIRQCGDRGIQQAVVVASGFAEVGPSGRALQDDVTRVAREAGVRVLGPNCIGVMNLNAGKVLSFASAVSEFTAPVGGGPVAVVSQSGAIGNLMLAVAQHRGIRIGSVITTGNEADLAWADAARWAADDDATEVVVGYLEAVRDGRMFSDALAHLNERGKRVVLLKSGRTSAGARTSAGHTGTLAGDDRVFQAVCERYGVQLVDDMRGLLHAASAGTLAAKGSRVGIVTASGGLAAILADQCADRGLAVPALSPTTSAAIGELIPSFGAAHNPVDVTGQVVNDPAMLSGVVGTLGDAGEVDAIGLFVGSNASQETVVAENLAAVAATSRVPIVACWVGGSGRFIPTMNRRGLPAFDDPTDALDAIALIAHRAVLSAVEGGSSPAPQPVGEARPQSDLATVWSALEHAGVPMVRSEISTRAELEHALTRWHANVYLKTIEEGLVHKSDVGAVVGPISPRDLEAVRALMARRSNASLFEIQEAVDAKAELFLGVKADPTFGPTVLLGSGGMWVEALDQVQAFIPPVAPGEVHRRMRKIGIVNAAIEGKRGMAPIDLVELSRIADAACSVAVRLGLESLECNPVTVDANGAFRVVDLVFTQMQPQPEGT